MDRMMRLLDRLLWVLAGMLVLGVLAAIFWHWGVP